MSDDKNREINLKDDREFLIKELEDGCKPKEDWRIGTEHEKFAYYKNNHKLVTYSGERSIEYIFDSLINKYDWQPFHERGKIIALLGKGDNKGSSITLEPGGQLELSGATLENIFQTCNETHEHLDELQNICSDIDIGFLGLGFSPKWTIDETPKMPKQRYAIMSRRMLETGSMGLDMMYRSCTVQVNLDYSSEADMVKKFRVALALQPIATALFACSPFTEGKPNGFQSYRSHIWLDTDGDRTGMIPFVFEDGMGFERYVDYALDVPMYFVYRDENYYDTGHVTFREFLDKGLDGYHNIKPTLEDWSNHLTTLFPEVRMKKFLEMRGADSGPWSSLCTLPALWVGILYDQTSLDAAYDLISDWSEIERKSLRMQTPEHGFFTPFRNRSVHDIAKEMVDISKAGLKQRNILNDEGNDESLFLDYLYNFLDKKENLAQKLLDKYANEWQGNIEKIFFKAGNE